MCEIEHQVKSRGITAGMMPSSAHKLRLLCLHGFRSSGCILRQQIEEAKWMKEIGDLVELIFVDAPWLATGPSHLEKDFKPPYYEWYQANKCDESALSSTRDNFSEAEPLQEFTEARGLDVAVEYLEKTIEDHGPIDGFLAFSQGAILGCALIGLEEMVPHFEVTNKADSVQESSLRIDVPFYFQITQIFILFHSSMSSGSML
uniref:Serine hydrolase domain-containing protein n=1 Tax=Physcomitrium patens TaxID=3218 RepID=A0A2K1J1I6_PHYPA|nr:hypothetical protein PHYPA_023293 [Physcomitrium patens]